MIDFHEYERTRLTIIKDGRVFDKEFTERGVVTKATQFAREIFNSKEGNKDPKVACLVCGSIVPVRHINAGECLDCCG